MEYSLDLLKKLLITIFKVFYTIIKTMGGPIYTTTMKILLISGVLYLISNFVPHGIDFLSSITFIGWCTIILVYRLVTFKYDDFETDDFEKIQNDDTEDEQTINEDTPEVDEKPAPNVRVKELINGSTRE